MTSDLQEIAPGVRVQTSRLWHINSVVITAAKDGRTVGSVQSQPPYTVIVDPAWFPDEIGALRKAAAATPAGRATHVLFTHGDYDHVVGWQSFPEADAIIAHPGAAERNADETERSVAELDRQNGTTRHPAFRYPPAQRFLSIPSLDLSPTDRLLFFAAPGHEADGLFTVLPDRGVLVSGDYLSDIEFPFIHDSLPAYRSTLQRARQLYQRYALTQVVPGHGHVATAAAEIERRIAVDLDYLDRLEAGVAKAKSAGLSSEQTVEQLRDFSYAGEPLTGSRWADLAPNHAENVRFVYARLATA